MQVVSGLEPRLTASQRDVVIGIVTSGHRVDPVEALAGTGKTTCAAALNEVYGRAGYRVVGAAPTARAVRELKERAGIGEARTLDGWALKLAAEPDALITAGRGEDAAGRERAVLVLDEAGMAPTRVSAEVIDRAIATASRSWRLETR